MDVRQLMQELAASSQKAARVLANASGQIKSRSLLALADLLRRNQETLLEVNARDVQAARDQGLDAARIDRLTLTSEVVGSMAEACEHVANLPDPVGCIESMAKRPNGMLVGKMRIPLGVVAMIFESRPNVTIDAGILCVYAGNGLILRGGSEAYQSNQALAGLFSQALIDNGLPAEAVQLVPTTDRAAVQAMLHLDDLIDVVIPRGGEGLIRAVVEEARMPVLKHYKGVCHLYADELLDLDQAVEIIDNAKVQRPGVCNALECLLVHSTRVEDLLPAVARRLGPKGVEFRADSRALEHLGGFAVPARPEDYGQEFHSLVLAVRVVDSQDEAQAHIAEYGSNHTEGILTRDHDRAMRFVREVDASLVTVNASTRFNDGGQLGLGAEIGISTSKLHSYGPMGVRELTTTKFVLLGQGQVRT
jgi:glutamate-5-semialdehyde dehydrogenase